MATGSRTSASGMRRPSRDRRPGPVPRPAATAPAGTEPTRPSSGARRRAGARVPRTANCEVDGGTRPRPCRRRPLRTPARGVRLHTRRREVDLLLDAGKRLVAAQQASISKGSRSELDAAQVSLRKSVASLTDAAGKILGTRASTSTLARVAETLRAAATVAEGRELLARGCLVEELSDTGWDLVAALTPA